MAYKNSLFSFFFFFFLNILLSSHAQMVPALFVFGDSLVDVGNNNHLKLSLAKANFPHNGVDYPGRKATGRFSNGKNAADFLGGLNDGEGVVSYGKRLVYHLDIDYLFYHHDCEFSVTWIDRQDLGSLQIGPHQATKAEKLGLPTSPPYLSISTASNKSNAFLTGVSFASGGAGILDGSDSTLGQALPLNKQIEYYSTVYGEFVQQLGSVEAQNHLSKSLFAVVIGSNDILGYYGSDSKLRSNYTPQQFVDLLLGTLTGQLKRLYNLGVRKVLFVGAGAIGCSPSQRNHNKAGECDEEVNNLSLQYNQGVKKLLQGLKSDLEAINYSFFDTYSVLLDYIQHPATYGFTEVKAACCGLGNLNAKVACLPISSFCPNRKDHVFWDLYHPTEAASRMFTDAFFDGSQKYVEPINVKQLIVL